MTLIQLSVSDKGTATLSGGYSLTCCAIVVNMTVTFQAIRVGEIEAKNNCSYKFSDTLTRVDSKWFFCRLIEKLNSVWHSKKE